MDAEHQKLRFFLTTPHSCNYIDGREATSLFADPLFPKNKSLYSLLVSHGFRRSGEHLYKPHCFQCSECVPVRIPVNEFQQRRHHRRAMKKNQDLVMRRLQADYYEEHFQLYCQYLAARHPGGGMDNPTADNYRDFLWCNWSDTWLYEYRLGDALLAVAVVDKLDDGNSAVYTFFDTTCPDRALGKYAILSLVKETQQAGLPWLYLGYWIDGCDKMKYKIDYQPVECFLDDRWKRFQRLAGKDFAVDP